MSTTNGSSRKATSPKRKPFSNGSNGNGVNLDAIRLRLFDPQRERKEYELDVIVIGQVHSYEQYLTEKFGQKPASNKVIEILLEDSLKRNSEFQSWLREKNNNRNLNNNVGGDEDYDALLEKLDPAANTSSQK